LEQKSPEIFQTKNRELKEAEASNEPINKIAEQSIYANRRQSPTRKANAGGGMRRCQRSLQPKKSAVLRLNKRK
jgi:hypothetical protein